MDRYRRLPSYHYKNNEDGLLTESVGKPLRDYKIYGNLAYDGLPIEYQRVEYIESTGTQYIKTGVAPQHTFPGFDATFLTKNALSTSGFGAILGVRTASKYVEFQLSTYSSGTSGILRYSDQEHDAGLVAGEKTHVTLKNRVYTDSSGVSTSITASFNGPEYQIALFALNEKNTIKQYGKVQLYSLKLYSGDIVVRDFIPCYRKSDGEIGLYDLARRHFYTNDGTGTFLKGNDIYQSPNTPVIHTSVGNAVLPEEYQRVSCIETTGGQYINTNFTPTGKLTVEGKISLPQPTKEVARLGTEGYGWEFGFPSSGNRMFSYLKTVSSIGVNPTTSIYNTLLDFVAVNDYDNNYRSLGLNIDNSFVDSSSVDTSYRQNLLLFDYRKTYPFVGKCYGMKIYDNDVLVRDFIPCYRKSDGVIGMYDLVDEIFYTNEGTGVFLKGEDKNLYKNIYKIPITLRGKNISPFYQPTTVITNITTTITSDTIEFDGDGTADYRCVTTGKLSPGTYALCISQLSGAESMESTYEAFFIWKKNTWVALAMCYVPNTGQ